MSRYFSLSWLSGYINGLNFICQVFARGVLLKCHYCLISCDMTVSVNCEANLQGCHHCLENLQGLQTILLDVKLLLLVIFYMACTFIQLMVMWSVTLLSETNITLATYEMSM